MLWCGIGGVRRIWGLRINTAHECIFFECLPCAHLVCSTFILATCECVNIFLLILLGQATAAGAKEQDATNALEKKFKAAPERPLDANETVRLAITTMQGVLSSDFKATEIEISLVSEGLDGMWISEDSWRGWNEDRNDTYILFVFTSIPSKHAARICVHCRCARGSVCGCSLRRKLRAI